jgi:glutaminyl-peptide cyclotransferase
MLTSKLKYLRLFVLALALSACSAGSQATVGTPATLPPAPTISQAPVAPSAPPTATNGAIIVAPLLVKPKPTPDPSAVPVATYRVRNTYPHDPAAFTQGLVYEDGLLYEGTGLNGQSTLRKVELETGNVLQTHAISDTYFGEGITIFGDKIIQLTWQSQLGFVYDKATFAPLGEFHYPTEGWGLTHDGQRLIMSDGTATLHFLDPQTFQELGHLDIHDSSGPVVRLNELEYIHGEIYANIWQTDMIARISPQSGQVLGWIDLAGLLSPEERQPPADVLNGIAYDPASDRLFVTGKRWPKLFEIEVVAP